MIAGSGAAAIVRAETGHEKPAAVVIDQAKIVIPQGVADQSISAWQSKLLDEAFEIASLIPVKPHIKDRSRIQESVVQGAFQLDQPRRAHGYVERIDNWRRGAGYADFALYCARHGVTEGLDSLLKIAEKISEASEQDWRRDTIRVKIAQVHIVLDQKEKAAKFDQDVDPSLKGKTAASKVGRDQQNAYIQAMGLLTEQVASGGLDLMKNGFSGMVELRDRFYDDQSRRGELEKAIKTGWARYPTFLKIDLLMTMAESSIRHSDHDESLRMINEAQTLMDGAEWPVDFHIPLKARLAAVRFRAGDAAKARSEVDGAVEMFKKRREAIVNIDRAGALRPVAEAYQAMGQTALSLNVYKMAVDSGALNPNARPRALDLAATCLSMAVNGVEPDAVLKARIDQIHQGLSNPW